MRSPVPTAERKNYDIVSGRKDINSTDAAAPRRLRARKVDPAARGWPPCMRALLLAALLAASAFAAAPAAAGCPDPDNPCTPPTIEPTDLLPVCRGTPAKQLVACLKEALP